MCLHLFKQVVAEIEIGNRSPASQVSILSLHNTENNPLDRKKYVSSIWITVFVMIKGMNEKQ